MTEHERVALIGEIVAFETVVEEFANFRDVSFPGRVVPKCWRAQKQCVIELRTIVVLHAWSAISAEDAKEKLGALAEDLRKTQNHLVRLMFDQGATS